MECQKGQLESVTTIFFDLDNTLIPTREGDELTCDEVVRLLCDHYSMPKNTAISITRTFLENFRKCPHDTDFRLDEWRVSLWKNALTEEYKGFAEEIYMMWLSLRYEYVAPGILIIKMLEQLRRKWNYNLALITNGSSESQWEKIKLLNLSDYFDLILVSGDLPWEKPNANIFFKACELLGVKPAHCIMVGDKVETDINGAIFAGLNSTFLVKLKSHEKERKFEFGGPNYFLDTVLSLPSFLPRVNEPSCLLTRSRSFFAEEDSNYSNASDGS